MCTTITKRRNGSISMAVVLREHIVKATIYSAVLVHAAQSWLVSENQLSNLVNGLVVVFAFWMVWGEVNFIFQRIRKQLPPGTLGFPILREIRFFSSIVNNTLNDLLQEAKERYGPLFAAQTPLGVTVTIGGENHLNWLFRQDRKALTDVSWPPNIQMLLGEHSLSNQVGKYHRTLRRLLEPYFAPTFVQNYAQCMADTTQTELEKWCSSGGFQSSEVFKLYALRLFYVSSFGHVDEPTLKELHDDFKIWISGFFVLTTTRFPGTTIDKAMKARDRIFATIDRLIDAFKEENPAGSERALTTIIGSLIYGQSGAGSGERLSRDQIRANILVLIFAGHDTTYMSISTILHHLSQNPETLKALVAEIDAMQKTDKIDFDALKNAPVLNAVIFESLRMDPPVPGGFRKVQKEALEYDGYNFPVGTVFNYSILMTTTDEEKYPTKDKFCMERFLPEDHALYRKELDSKIDPRQGKSVYPVFGGGTHVCLGKAFALLELRIVVTQMLRDYTVEMKNNAKVVIPVNGWTVDFKLTKRKDE